MLDNTNVYVCLKQIAKRWKKTQKLSDNKSILFQYTLEYWLYNKHVNNFSLVYVFDINKNVNSYS